MKTTNISIILITFSLAASASVPLRWTVETSRLQPVVFDAVRGESLDLEASFQTYGTPLAMAGKDVRIFYQTNGMGSAWWTGAATATSNRIAATFTPAMDPGGTFVKGFLGSTGDIYRASFTLRFRPGPGATPNVIAQPPRILDLATTTVINPPWPTDETIATRIRTVIDEDGITAPIETNVLREISGETTSNIVTRSFVEGLGITGGGGGGGVDTNAVRAIIEADVGGTNTLAHEGTGASQIVRGETMGDAWFISVNYAYSAGEANDLSAIYWDDEGKHPTTISGYGITDAYTKTETDALTDGKADAGTVTQLGNQVAAIGSLLNGDDAHFVSTNYDSVVRLPEAYVEIKQNGNWITIWKEMTRWNRFVGDGFDWSTNSWSGFQTWRTNVTSELSFKAERNWGMYDSETGGLSPEGYTQISSSNLLIAANMAYQRTVTSGGSVWVLQCNSGTATFGGETNGYFRVCDGDGNVQFEIVRGDRREMGADATGINVDNSTSPATVSIPYSVEADEHPTLRICDDLATANWKDETDSECIANVTWLGSSGAWLARVKRKTAGTSLFVKATYMAGGETYIRNAAPVSMTSIYLNGTKYYLGTATISGHTVLTLSTTAPAN